MRYRIGFIGFGEAAYNIAEGLWGEGFKPVAAYDVLLTDDTLCADIKRKAHSINVDLKESLQELCKCSDFLFSLTSPSVCREVAIAAAEYLSCDQVFCDLNSANPKDMQEAAAVYAEKNIPFVDVAVLGAVPTQKHKSKMLFSGAGSKQLYALLEPYNTQIEILDADAGGASAIKMLKSVFSKGIMQLMLEAYVPAYAAGVLDKVIDFTKDSLKGMNLEEFGNRYLYRTLIHAGRRSAEAKACAQTVEALGYDASMSRATQNRLEQLAKHNFKARIGSKELNLRETIALVAGDF